MKYESFIYYFRIILIESINDNKELSNNNKWNLMAHEYLKKAKKAKNDEFYTQYIDIQKEVSVEWPQVSRYFFIQLTPWVE